MELPNDLCKATGWVTESYWIVHISRKQLYNYYVLLYQYKHQKNAAGNFLLGKRSGVIILLLDYGTLFPGALFNKQVYWLIFSINTLLNPLCDGLKPF